MLCASKTKQKIENYEWRAVGTFLTKQHNFDNSTSGTKHPDIEPMRPDI